MLYKSNITKLAAISWFSLFALINAVGVSSLKAQVNTAAISGTVLKDTAIPKVSEAFHAQFRAEFFNLFNHTNFGNPNPDVFASSGPNTFAVNQVIGQITQINTTARQIQFALKLIF